MGRDLRSQPQHGASSVANSTRNETGTLDLDGDAVTASGLVFTAASEQPLLRALDASKGVELWSGALPVRAQATPMTYMYKDRQSVVIAAGGFRVENGQLCSGANWILNHSLRNTPRPSMSRLGDSLRVT
jgi:hypothetical protein